jgi:uncharacterized protein (TIGR02646 family)
MNIGFERIAPTPLYAEGVDINTFSGLSWTSRAAVVTHFKSTLKTELRRVQAGLCCYCRRPLPSDDLVTHLEHFVEKAAHPGFTFEIRNLALSCATCNSKKNASFSLLCGKLSRRASARAGVPTEIKRCPVLATSTVPVAINNSQDYRWVHPHLDNLSDHLTIAKGYIFRQRTLKGHRTIKGMDLNSLGRLEHRAAVERLSNRQGVVSLAFGIAAQLEYNTAPQVFSMVAAVVRGKLKAAGEGAGG